MDPYKETHDKSPLEPERKQTNFIFIFVSAALCIWWIISIITEAPPETRASKSNVTVTDFVLWLESRIFITIVLRYQFSGSFFSVGVDTLIGIIVYSIIFIVFFWKPKILAYFGATLWGLINLIWIGLIITLLVLLRIFVQTGEFNLFFRNLVAILPFTQEECVYAIVFAVTIPWFCCFAYFFTIFYSIIYTGIGKIAKFMEQATSPLFKHHTITCFAVAVTLVEYGLIIFTIKVYKLGSGQAITLNMTLIGSIYVMRMLSNFETMVIAQTVAAHHWHKDSADIPPKAIFKSMFIVLRYHMGALALASISFVPTILGLLVCLAGPRPLLYQYKLRHYVTEFFTKLYVLFLLQKYAISMVAIQGLGFFRALEKTHYLMVKNTSFFFGSSRAFGILFELIPTYIIIHQFMKATGDYDVCVTLLTFAIMEVTFAANIATVLRMLEYDEEVAEPNPDQ